MAAILSQSQLTACLGNIARRESVHYRQHLVWHCRRLAGCHVTFNGTGVSGITLDPALERERLTGALEEAAKSFAAIANALLLVHKKKRRLFRSLLTPAFGYPAASRIVCRVDKGSVAEWAVKTVIEKFADSLPR